LYNVAKQKAQKSESKGVESFNDRLLDSAISNEETTILLCILPTGCVQLHNHSNSQQ